MTDEEPAAGRVYRAGRTVRLGDVDRAGRLRLDACARYLQDVSSDDTRDAALPDDGSWVVRRTAIRVHSAPRYLEAVRLATWCSGTGSRWAERTITVVGDGGGSVTATSLWIYVELATMMPKRLPEGFLRLYGEAAGGRTVGSRLALPAPGAGLPERPWPLRATDVDVLGHVNNAAYWEAVEEVLAARPDLTGAPLDAVVEFARPIAPGGDVALVVDDRPDRVDLWLTVAGTVHAAARAGPPGELGMVIGSIA